MALGKRVGCVVASVVAGIPVATVVAVLASSIPEPTEIPAPLAEAAFERECAEAARLGLTLASRSPSPVPVEQSPPSVDVQLDAGECVAVVAAAWGFQVVASVGVHEPVASSDPVALSTQSPDGGLVGHAQWCADAPSTVRLAVELKSRDFYAREGSTRGHLRMAVYRGPGASFGGLRGITRGVLTERAYRRVSVSTLVADADRRVPPTAIPLARELPIAPDAALLIPEDATTYRVLHDAARNGSSHAVSPRVSPLPVDVPAAWRPAAAFGVTTSIAALRAQVASDTGPGAQFPLFVADDDARRALVVVDARRLGAPCAELRFVRMLFGHRAGVSRVTADRATVTPLAQVDNEARDRLCAGQGVVAYVVPPEDHEAYRLRTYVAP